MDYLGPRMLDIGRFLSTSDILGPSFICRIFGRNLHMYTVNTADIADSGKLRIR